MFIHVTYCLLSGLGTITAMFIQITVFCSSHVHSDFCFCSDLGSSILLSVLWSICYYCHFHLHVFWSRCNNCHVHPCCSLCSGLGIISAMFIQITNLMCAAVSVITAMFTQFTNCLSSGLCAIAIMSIQCAVFVLI